MKKVITYEASLEEMKEVYKELTKKSIKCEELIIDHEIGIITITCIFSKGLSEGLSTNLTVTNDYCKTTYGGPFYHSKPNLLDNIKFMMSAIGLNFMITKTPNEV